MSNITIAPPGKKSITIVVSRTVFPGHERDYDEWVRKMVAAARESPGNQGVTTLLPEQGKSGLHHLVFQFADEKSMHIWETAYIRQKLTHEADAFSRSVRQEASGLETWFSIPECPELETPPRWKMSLVTFGAVYLLSVGIIELLHTFEHLNFYAESLIVAGVLVFLLSYAVMPFLSRYIFRRWLYRRR